MQHYQTEYQRSIDDREGFWAEQAHRLPWFKAPRAVLDLDAEGRSRWYADGELNLCHAALDHHVEQGRGDQVAVFWDSPVGGDKSRLSYRELRDRVARFAGVLRGAGVGKGDPVIIYMPMVSEAMIAMLACARLGAVHSVVFGGFAARELAVRIADIEPKVVVTASCGLEADRILPYKPIVDEAVTLSRCRLAACIVLQREQHRAELGGGDLDWMEAERSAPLVDCVAVRSTDPLYVLYTSGTTGKPKGVVRDTGGYGVALHYSMEVIYDMAPGEVFFSASDVGWVVGHSYIVYGPLLRGCSTLLYEGKPVRTPDAGAFWRLLAEYRVKCFFTAPTAFRAIKKEDPQGLLMRGYDLSALESLFLAGERLDPPTFHWLDALLDVPVIDHWWQTETGWPVAANPLGLEPVPPKAGSAALPVPGFEVQVLDREGQPLAVNEQGAVVLKQPLPPGCLVGLWRDPQRFQASYMTAYPGYYLSGDGGYFDADGYLFIMGRTDDVINVAGHRLSTGEMEEVVGAHPAVAECAVIGIQDALKGQLPVGLVIVKDGVDYEAEALEAELVVRVRQHIGAIACLRQVVMVERLPKTRSGKILRKLLRSIADGEAYGIPSTIDDPSSLDEVHDIMRHYAIGAADKARRE